MNDGGGGDEVRERERIWADGAASEGGNGRVELGRRAGVAEIGSLHPEANAGFLARSHPLTTFDRIPFIYCLVFSIYPAAIR